MHRLWLLAPALSFLVLAAHFHRAGLLLGVALCLALVALLAVPRRWAAWVVQAGLALGALEWLRTLVMLVQMRIALEQPWLRMALILGIVATLTAASALVFRRPSLRERFRLH